MSDLKARASRELNRTGERRERRWTRHGSTRYLFNAISVGRAMRYTLEEQGPPMAVFPTAKEPRTE